MIFVLNLEVYLPREDTYLMQSVLEKIDLKNKKVLEVGTGSGYLAIFCAKRGANVVAVDINSEAVEYAKKNAKKEKAKINFLLSDLFSNIKDKYDVIFFNPPYLISDEIEHVALDGGKEGREIIDKFLYDFDKHLNEKGFVLLLHTDYNNLEKTKNILQNKGYIFSIATSQHLFFEELYILEIKAV